MPDRRKDKKYKVKRYKHMLKTSRYRNNPIFENVFKWSSAWVKSDHRVVICGNTSIENLCNSKPVWDIVRRYAK